jgi:hypothetical protein
MAGLDDLTDDKRAAIVTALRQTIDRDRDRYPLSPAAEAFQIGAGEADPASVPKTRLSGRRCLTRAAEGRGDRLAGHKYRQ